MIECGNIADKVKVARFDDIRQNSLCFCIFALIHIGLAKKGSCSIDCEACRAILITNSLTLSKFSSLDNVI